MNLIPNAGPVLKHAWSVRLIIAAALLSAIEVGLAIFGPFLPVRPGIFAALSMAVTFAAFVARFVAQTKLSGDQS